MGYGIVDRPRRVWRDVPRRVLGQDRVRLGIFAAKRRALARCIAGTRAACAVDVFGGLGRCVASGHWDGLWRSSRIRSSEFASIR